MEQSNTPIVKSLARLVTDAELSQVSGAGTVVKTSSAAAVSTDETTYNHDGTKNLGTDTIVRD